MKNMPQHMLLINVSLKSCLWNMKILCRFQLRVLQTLLEITASVVKQPLTCISEIFRIFREGFRFIRYIFHCNLPIALFDRSFSVYSFASHAWTQLMSDLFM